MHVLIEEFLQTKKAQEYIENIRSKQSPITLSGLTGVAKAIIIAATKQAIGKPICIITYNELQAKQVKRDLESLLPNGNIVYFPKKEIASYDYLAQSNELAFDRMRILNAIYEQKNHIIITTIVTIKTISDIPLLFLICFPLCLFFTFKYYHIHPKKHIFYFSNVIN